MRMSRGPAATTCGPPTNSSSHSPAFPTSNSAPVWCSASMRAQLRPSWLMARPGRRRRPSRSPPSSSRLACGRVRAGEGVAWGKGGTGAGHGCQGGKADTQLRSKWQAGSFLQPVPPHNPPCPGKRRHADPPPPTCLRHARGQGDGLKGAAAVEHPVHAGTAADRAAGQDLHVGHVHVAGVKPPPVAVGLQHLAHVQRALRAAGALDAPRPPPPVDAVGRHRHACGRHGGGVKAAGAGMSAAYDASKLAACSMHATLLLPAHMPPPQHLCFRRRGRCRPCPGRPPSAPCTT